ncbi:MAG: ABC transporter permease [Saprospiraceae bacterium]|nr:ABC transporter permease [Saprospiraceae bacterium]
MMNRIFFHLRLALEGINANKLRAFLTALGIVFGVGAVIAMLAIGTGAKQAILDQMKLIGANNIVIKSVIPSEDDEDNNKANQSAAGNTNNNTNKDKLPWSPGLTLADLEGIAKVTPTVWKISPEIVVPVSIIQSGRLEKSRCVGVTNSFFELNQMRVEKGAFFSQGQIDAGRPVCIIGKNIQTRFFGTDEALGKQIKCGQNWFTVIGILEKRVASEESLKSLGIRDYNDDVYIPVTTVLLRFNNRALITKSDVGRGGGWGNQEETDKNYHQLDRAIVQVNQSENLRATADVIARILKRRHHDVLDYEIEVPELLLEQEQKTQETFNLVLAVIAGISLLVGGIGIMNIMLASVLERIKEIGLRRSLGATRRDIVFQFLLEAVLISLFGGLIGVILGIVSARLIASQAEIPTVISGWSILLAFGVAAVIGITFGLFPARKAAIQDPIKALRTE